MPVPVQQIVAKIDPWSQFHQHFTSSFFADILAPKNYKAECHSFVIFEAKILAINAQVKC